MALSVRHRTRSPRRHEHTSRSPVVLSPSRGAADVVVPGSLIATGALDENQVLGVPVSPTALKAGYGALTLGYLVLFMWSLSLELSGKRRDVEILMIVQLVNGIHVAAKTFDYPWSEIDFICQSMLVPATFYIPFEIGRRLHVPHGMFQIKEEVIILIIVCMAVYGLYLCTESWKVHQLPEEQFRLPHVVEVLVNFIFLGLSMLVWHQSHMYGLMLGCILHTTGLVFPSMPTEATRFVFFCAVLLTEDQIRRPLMVPLL